MFYGLFYNAVHIKEELSYLTRSWYPNCAWPVVIEMCQFVGEFLEVVRLQSRTVMDHNIVSGCDCSLTDMLRHQEEIKPEIHI